MKTLATPTTNTNAHAANELNEAPSNDLFALPPNCDGVGDATDVALPPRALLVVVAVANATEEACDGTDGRIVAEAGVGNEIVADRALKDWDASALFAA
tara:strand:+ start:2662 stop:2958 length:297 start_codon:yes stop_codon:yes gene_type:complete